MPSWIKADLSDQAGAPGATSSPYAYVTPFDSSETARVVYTARGGHIQELRLEPGGPWKKANLTDQAGAPDAAGRPHAYLTPINAHQTARVLYRGQDSHIHELRLEPGQSWKKADLSQQAGAPDAAGDPFGYFTREGSEVTVRVVYRANDGHIHELHLDAGQTWKAADLSHRAGAPSATGNPFAYVTSANSAQTARVLYVGEDSHVHELRLEPGGSWIKADLTDLTGAPDASGNPAAYLTRFNGNPTARVLYRGRDSHLHELRLEPGSSWKKADLMALTGRPNAESDPFGYVTPVNSHQTARVLYLSSNGHLHELRLEPGGSWQGADLTDLTGAPGGEGSPFAYVTNAAAHPIPRVLYRAGDAHIHELRLE